NNEPGPACQKTKTTDRRDGAEPVPQLRDQRHRIKAAAEKQNAGSDQKIRDAIPGAVQCESDERDRVHEMIEPSLVPNFEHSALLQRRPQSMRAECAETHCEKTERGGNAKKRNNHSLFPAEKFPKRLNDAVRQRAGLLPEILQFLRELRLRASVNFTRNLRYLVI